MNERKLFIIQQFLALFASRDCMWISPLHAHSTPIAKMGAPVFCSLPLVPCTKSSLLGRKKCRGCCKCCYSQRKQPRPGLRLAQYAQGTAATLLTALQTRQELSSVQPPETLQRKTAEDTSTAVTTTPPELFSLWISVWQSEIFKPLNKGFTGKVFPKLLQPSWQAITASHCTAPVWTWMA